MSSVIEKLIAFLRKHDGVNDKSKLAKEAVDVFNLIKDRSVYYCNDFAIRFSASGGPKKCADNHDQPCDCGLDRLTTEIEARRIT